MKRTSRSSKLAWRKLSRRRESRRLKRARRKSLRIRNSEFTGAAIVRSPEYFLLERKDSHRDLAVFLSYLRTKLARGAVKILVDFRRTKLIFPGGGLLFYSEIQRLKDMFPDVRFFCRESRSDRVNQVLQHLGIYGMLGHRSKVQPRRADVVSWRHARSDHVNCTGAGTIIETYSSLTKPTTKLLYKAASEAVTNAVMHAYDEPREDGLPVPSRKSWWMFCREEENKFYMAVCDLGVGIPNTLTVKNAPELIDKILDKISFGNIPNDAQMILGAMEYARTRTRRPQQGKGLMDLRRIVDEKGSGKLFVFSNKGCASYVAGGDYMLTSYRKSILGTLIVWSIPLEPESNP